MSTETERIVVRFDNTSVAQANKYAEDLRQDLLDADASIDVERRREDPASLDFGATLLLLLGAPAIVVAAKGLKKWLARNNAVSLSLVTEQGVLVASNLESKDVPAIVEALS